MDKLLEWLKGKKTYIVAILTAALGVLQALGIFVVPEWVYVILASVFGITIRDAVKNVSEQVKPK